MSIVNIKNLINSSFRGSVYIVQGEEILCELVKGFADLANEIPNTVSNYGDNV